MEINEFYTIINGEEVQIATIQTEGKTDYVYNMRGELVTIVYNNDYKLARVLDKLSKKIEKGKQWIYLWKHWEKK